MVITKRLLSMNPYTRSGQLLELVSGVVVHYVRWPGATASRIRDYFETLPTTEPGRYASCHYVVGIEGEVELIVPESECAWHAGPSGATAPEVESLLGGLPNWRTIGIEMCHPGDDGAFTRATWRTTVALVKDLLRRYDLTHEGVLRHYDTVGKVCPKWFVDHPAEWAEFLQDVRS